MELSCSRRAMLLGSTDNDFQAIRGKSLLGDSQAFCKTPHRASHCGARNAVASSLPARRPLHCLSRTMKRLLPWHTISVLKVHVQLRRF